jgi:hypothetical protein
VPLSEPRTGFPSVLSGAALSARLSNATKHVLNPAGNYYFRIKTKSALAGVKTTRVTIVRNVFILLCALIATGPASAQSPPRSSTMYTCAIWTEMRLKNESADLENWVMGYLVSWSMEEHGENRDFKALFSYIDNYCLSNPLETLLIATMSLQHELVNRAKQPAYPAK